MHAVGDPKPNREAPMWIAIGLGIVLCLMMPQATPYVVGGFLAFLIYDAVR